MARLKKRVEAGDVVAMTRIGEYHIRGENGLPRNVAKGIELLEEAAKLGDVGAHLRLACSYDDGDYGSKKDVEKTLFHYEAAAMGGHVGARHYLGFLEAEDGKFNRALRHWTVSAKMGFERSLKEILQLCKDGHASRDNYAQALHGYRKATDEMFSHERDEANVLLSNTNLRY